MKISGGDPTDISSSSSSFFPSSVTSSFHMPTSNLILNSPSTLCPSSISNALIADADSATTTIDNNNDNSNDKINAYSINDNNVSSNNNNDNNSNDNSNNNDNKDNCFKLLKNIRNKNIG